MWIAELRSLRGIAIIAVIAIHCTGALWWIEMTPKINYIAFVTTTVNCFSMFAVPLFIMISGSSLSAKYFRDYSKLDFYRKRIVSVIPPYLFFSVLYLMLGVLVKNDLSPEPTKILFRLFTGSSSYHLWFIGLILMWYILYPLVVASYQRWRTKAYLALFLICTFFLIGFLFFYFVSSMPTFYEMSGELEEAFRILMRPAKFLFYLPFIILGVYFTKNIEHIKDWFENLSFGHRLLLWLIASVVLISYVIFMLNELYFPNRFPMLVSSFIFYLLDFFNALFITIVAIDLAILLAKNKSYAEKVLGFLGDYSYGIFLAHVLFIDFFAYLLKLYGIVGDNILFYPTILLCTIVTSTGFVYLLSKLPFSFWTVGIK